MDFAFVPGIGDSRLEHLSDLLQRLPNTVVALTPQPTGLSDFFSVVDQVIQNNGAGPAGNLLIGAHGDEEGQLFLALDPNTASPATYEKIVNSTTIAIPSGVKDALTFVRLKSCLLGTDATQPLLVALRRALGNPALVTSPRYIHATFGPYLDGLWEFMLYQFAILGDDLGKNPLKTRDALVAKFADPASGFKFVDQSNVPGSAWKDWVPAAAKITLAPSSSQDARVPFPVVATNVFGIIPAFLPIYIRLVSWFETVPLVPLDCDFVPVDAITKADTLNDLLAPRPEYQATHPYPVYQRYQHKNLRDFADGWNWAVKDSPGTKLKYSLQYIGTRYRYRLEIPITKPGTTNELIFNYYPDSGTPVVNFTETNDPFHLFGSA